MFMHAGISLSRIFIMHQLVYLSFPALLSQSLPFLLDQDVVFVILFFIMAEYFKYLRQLLAMQGESLRRNYEDW